MDRADELGLRAWDEFYTQRQRLYGVTDGRKSYFTSDSNRHHRFYRAFRDIAEMCLAKNIDVTDYVVTCFSLMSKNHQYITPRDFAKKDILEAYQKHKTVYGDDSKVAWASQSRDINDIATRMVPSLYKTIEDALLDPRQPFTAWFRVLCSKAYNETAAELYGQAAWEELRADKRLRTYLRGFRYASILQLERNFGSFGDVAAEALNV